MLGTLSTRCCVKHISQHLPSCACLRRRQPLCRSVAGWCTMLQHTNFQASLAGHTQTADTAFCCTAFFFRLHYRRLTHYVAVPTGGHRALDPTRTRRSGAAPAAAATASWRPTRTQGPTTRARDSKPCWGSAARHRWWRCLRAARRPTVLEGA